MVRCRHCHENARSRWCEFRIESQVSGHGLFCIPDGEADEFAAFLGELFEMLFVGQLPEAIEHSVNRNVQRIDVLLDVFEPVVDFNRLDVGQTLQILFGAFVNDLVCSVQTKTAEG